MTAWCAWARPDTPGLRCAYHASNIRIEPFVSKGPPGRFMHFSRENGLHNCTSTRCARHGIQAASCHEINRFPGGLRWGVQRTILFLGRNVLGPTGVGQSGMAFGQQRRGETVLSCPAPIGTYYAGRPRTTAPSSVAITPPLAERGFRL